MKSCIEMCVWGGGVTGADMFGYIKLAESSFSLQNCCVDEERTSIAFAHMLPLSPHAKILFILTSSVLV